VQIRNGGWANNNRGTHDECPQSSVLHTRMFVFASARACVVCLSVNQLSATAQFLGPFYSQSSNGNRDFYFLCQITVTPSNYTPDARFDVALVADGATINVKTSNMSLLSVTITSSDVSNMYGRTVSVHLYCYTTSVVLRLSKYLMQSTQCNFKIYIVCVLMN
jgi:hypothetical protein